MSPHQPPIALHPSYQAAGTGYLPGDQIVVSGSELVADAPDLRTPGSREI